jgi:glycine oxidase
MPTNKSQRYVIVGQGLAGSILGLLMDLDGFDVTLIDNDYKSSSSIVAAGMWNPVSFKKLNESWMASQQLDVAFEIYPKLEELLGAKFFHPQELVRIFPDNRAGNEWDERSVHPELSRYLTDKQDTEIASQCKQPFGHGVVKDAGWLDTLVFLSAAKNYFLNKSKLQLREFSIEDELTEIANGAIVIYCIGWKTLFHHSFPWVPLVPNKGEVLTFRNEHLQLNRMVNFGKFIIPLGKNTFRLGATYALNEPNPLPTAEGRNEMVNQFKEFFSHEPEIIDHKSGYRPTLLDRKPILGFHPENNQIGVFNGFGSKGVMLIPFFAKHFIDHLNGSNLMRDVNVVRFINRPTKTYESLITNFKFD